MRIAVIGGGPGGLYFAYLWKKRHPDAHIDLFEQNAAGATWGFGVVFSEQALEFLRADDPDTVDAIAPRMQSWNNITLNLRGESVEIDGVGFSSIGRLDLLGVLQQRVRAVGVTPRYDTLIASLDQLAGYDLIVAADGLNSLVRRSFEGDFGTSVSYSANKFAWYGTPKRFETLSQTFVETDLGAFNAHHYRYAPDMSTFLVECDRATWQRYGFADKTVEESRAICETVFADTLDGHPLVSNKSVWRNFPWIWNEHWSFRNMVLIGDALHSAHFSIGSGTRLAIEDVIALVKALEAERDLPAALARYEAERKPVVKKLVTAARASAAWYEKFPEHMKLGLMDFAYSYITRSGRIDDARLRAMSPLFMARYEARIARGTRHERAGSGQDARDRRQGACRQPRRVGDRFFDSANLQRQPYPVRQSVQRPAATACAHRAGRNAKLRRTLRRRIAMGTRFSIARIAARRSHPDVLRRYAGLSGRVLRRGPLRLRAAADQYADAARPAAVLPVGFGRLGRGCRCGVLRAVRCRGLQGYAVAHADRRQRRCRRSRRSRMR